MLQCSGWGRLMRRCNFTTIKKSGMRLIIRDEYKEALLRLGIEDSSTAI